jgi:hypothetical protein
VDFCASFLCPSGNQSAPLVSENDETDRCREDSKTMEDISKQAVPEWRRMPYIGH